MSKQQLQYKLTEDTYCYTQLVNDDRGQSLYGTVFVGPIYRVWIEGGKGRMQWSIGPTRFLHMKNTKPLFLLSIYVEALDKYGRNFDTYCVK